MKVDGTAVPLEGVIKTGNAVLAVMPQTAIEPGRTVTVSYRDPTSGDDMAAIQDLAGNDAASFTDFPVRTGPRPERAETDAEGTQVRLRFDEALDTVNPPALEQFTVKVDGTAVALDRLGSVRASTSPHWTRPLSRRPDSDRELPRPAARRQRHPDPPQRRRRFPIPPNRSTAPRRLPGSDLWVATMTGGSTPREPRGRRWFAVRCR